jgi:hypothetical protein
MQKNKQNIMKFKRNMTEKELANYKNYREARKSQRKNWKNKIKNKRK